VNRADWAIPDEIDIPDGWVIGNAPRPIQGKVTWQGPFRHGVFYAAAPEVPAGTFGWKADDAWLVTFISNEEIGQRVAAKLAEYGYQSADEAGLTVSEVAIGVLQLPWHE
jgi:hypothetical protein